jgi:hypothetical protein
LQKESACALRRLTLGDPLFKICFVTYLNFKEVFMKGLILGFVRASLFALIVFPLAVFGQGSGLSSYPLMADKRLVSGEFTGVVSEGGGVGLQARITQKVNKVITADAGAGIAGGKRSMRVFAGLDYEIFPDYKRQPRVSLKGTLSRSKEFSVERNVIEVSPMVSKGLNMWGSEVYPFLSLPYKVSLDGKTNTYVTAFNASLGINGKLPVQGYEKFIASVEGTFGVKDSYSGIFLGVSYPLN